MRRLAPAILLALVLVACTDRAERSDEAPRPVQVDWSESALPPAPDGWRVAVRDAAWCGDRWLVVGGLLSPGGEYGDRSRPAAWTSSDGARWEAERFRPQTYYGRRALLTTVACRGGAAAAVGLRPGGAHGNPRITTFRTTAEGTWVDVEAPFVQYGGAEAVNVGPVAAGPRGWLVAGNRVSGPAVWVGRSARDLDLVEGAAGLADTPDVRAIAQDGAWSGRGWVVVGGALTPGGPARSPQAWTSPDGRRWTREPVPTTADNADLLAVTPTPDGVLAVGIRDRRFGTWLRSDDGWQEDAAFGGLGDDLHASPGVASLSASGDEVWVTIGDGVRHRLFTAGADRAWSEVTVPQAPGTSADHTLVVAAGPDGLLLLADDGTGGRVWTSRD